MNAVKVLLVEDNPGDVRLTKEALKEAKIVISMDSASNGIEALKYLRSDINNGQKSSVDLILLDLNMPKMDGRELLKEIKNDPLLQPIPVIVLTTSESEEDIYESYNLRANCFISKPVDMDKFVETVQSIGDFWLTLVKLP